MSIISSVFTFYILYGVYLILNVLDGISTWLVLRPDHFEREANPIAKRIFIRLGIPRGIIITEAGVLTLLTPLLFFLAGTQLEITVALLFAANLVFIWVVTDNLKIAFRYRRKALAEHGSSPSNKVC